MYVRRTADPATRHSAQFPPPLFLSLLLSPALFLFYSLVCWILHALILCSATKQATNFYNSHTKHTHSNLAPLPFLLPHTHTPLTTRFLSLSAPSSSTQFCLSFCPRKCIFSSYEKQSFLPVEHSAATPPAPSLLLIVLFLVRFAIWKLFFYLFCPVSPFFFDKFAQQFELLTMEIHNTHRQKDRERDR